MKKKNIGGCIILRNKYNLKYGMKKKLELLKKRRKKRKKNKSKFKENVNLSITNKTN